MTGAPALPAPTTLLAGKTVLVLGAGPGLGRRIAVAARAAGASVMLGARSHDKLARLAEELDAAYPGAACGGSGGVAFEVCDITCDKACRSIVAGAEREFGGLDCVVQNAFASAPPGLTVEHGDLDEWRASFEVNLFGSLRLARAAIPALRRRGGGSIVFVGSQITRRVLAGRGPYAASKAALLTAAQVLAREVGPERIRVNTVVPGRMWGPSLRARLGDLAAERGTTPGAERARMAADVALPELVTDEECARAVVFLAGDLSAGMTGQSIDVNAGETFH